MAGKVNQAGQVAAIDTAAKSQLEDIIKECIQSAEASLGKGRRYYFASYLLMVLSVGGSVLAGVLALWDGVDKAWVGTVALVPALCATVAGQLRLVEKADWFYRKRNAMRALARDFALDRDRGVGFDQLAAANERLTAAESRFEHEWSQNNAFRFEIEQRAG